jgi:hypothetical protein
MLYEFADFEVYTTVLLWIPFSWDTSGFWYLNVIQCPHLQGLNSPMLCTVDCQHVDATLSHNITI